MEALTSLFFFVVLCCLFAAINKRYRRGALLTAVSCFGLYLFAGQVLRAARDVRVPSPPATNVATASPLSLVVQPAAPSKPSHAGVARICLTNDRDALKSGDVVLVPRTTVFTDEGPNTGKADDAESWHYEVKEGGFSRAAFETLAAVTLTHDKVCGEAPVGMVTSSEWPATNATAADHHLYAIHGVTDYAIPPKRPALEFGKLVDDIAVMALVTADVEQTRPFPEVSAMDDPTRLASCRAVATKIAPALGATLGRQTHMMVSLEGTAARDIQVDCAMTSSPPDVFVGWDGAKPPAATKAVIGKAGSLLTGLTPAEIISEVNACVTAALKPDVGEMNERHYKGARVECQAFVRDGGGGSVTIYRLYGKQTKTAKPEDAEIEAARPGATEAIAAFEHPAEPPAPKPQDATTYFIDASVHTTLPFFGCPEQAALDKVKAMVRANDTVAMAKAALQGGCVAIEADTHGTVQDHSVWHAATCLRQRGEPDCLWFPDALIAKD